MPESRGVLVRSHGGSAAVRVIEAAYAEASSLGAWLDGIVDHARPLLASDLGLIATVTRRETARIAIEAYSEIDNPLSWIRSTYEQACREIDPRHFDAYYGPGDPVRTLDDIRGILATSGDAVDVGSIFVELGALQDLQLLVVHPTANTVLTIAALDRGTRVTTRATRRRLTQVALHLENAARLHLASHDEVAVLTPDGRIVHAFPDRSTPDDLASLGDRVRSVERIRVEACRHRDSEGLDAWPALVDGVYSLVERTDHDGRRHYVAIENSVSSRHLRVLDTRERSVLELSARGLSGKWVAYSLGLPQSAVSEALASAAGKFGIASRTRLVAIAAALLGGNEGPHADVGFTAAERELLPLVADGLSNEEIAAARGRSVHTVANQIGSLLRKTGLGSRRALALFASEGAVRRPSGIAPRPGVVPESAQSGVDADERAAGVLRAPTTSG